MLRQWLVVLSLLLLPVIPLFSQARRGSMGSGTLPASLEIQLTAWGSRPLQDVPVLIEIEAVGGSSPQRGYTDSYGRVRFTVPSGTRYQMTASGPGIENKSVSFEIPPSQRFHHEELQVELHEGGTATKAPGGMVSAENLRVPEKAGHEFAKGMKEMGAHNWSKAREHFEKAIKDYPQFDWAYNNIGVADIQEKNVRGAREAFEKAVSINGKNPDAVRNLSKMKLADNDFSGAKELLLKIGPNANDLDSLTMLAYAQLKTHELEAALANALKVHHGEPDHFPLAHLIAARVYEVKGNQSAAQTQYQMYLKEAPDSPEARIAKEGMQRLAASQ